MVKPKKDNLANIGDYTLHYLNGKPCIAKILDITSKGQRIKRTHRASVFKEFVYEVSLKVFIDANSKRKKFPYYKKFITHNIELISPDETEIKKRAIREHTNSYAYIAQPTTTVFSSTSNIENILALYS